MSEFVEPSDKERLAALHGLTDAALVGHYWRLEDLDGLTDDERRRLKRYRHETFGFEDYCETLVARSDREPEDVADLTAVLDRWEGVFLGLKCWQHERSVLDYERNPVAKVLIYEESRITGVRGRLGPRLAVVDQHPGAPAVRARPPRARSPRGVSGRGASERSAAERAGSTKTSSARTISLGDMPTGDGGPDAEALTDAILVLAAAVDRLAEVISRRPGSRTPPEPRSGRAADLNASAPHGT